MTRAKALALIALTAAGAGIGVSPVRAQGNPDKIQVAGVPTEDATNMYWAVKTGFFERAGLDVEMVDTSSGAAATTAVIGGTYQIARPSLFAVMLAHVRGIDVRCISAANLHDARNPMALLQVATDATIHTGADLNGKTIGVPALNDLNTVAIRAWTDKNGGDWRSLKFVELPNSALEPSLSAHRIDAAVLQSPFIWTSLAAGTTRTLGDAWGAISPRFLSGVCIARGDWAGAHRDLVRRFIDTYYGAVKYVNAHIPETAQYTAELTKVDLATAQKLHRSIGPTSLEVGLVQPLIDAAVKYGVLQQPFPAREFFLS